MRDGNENEARCAGLFRHRNSDAMVYLLAREKRIFRIKYCESSTEHSYEDARNMCTCTAFVSGFCTSRAPRLQECILNTTLIKSANVARRAM